MINIESSKISQIALHRVGNKHNEDNLFMSERVLSLSEDTVELLNSFFLKPFINISEKYNFSSADTDNELQSISEKVFLDNDLFFEQSKSIAQYLYECSNHPHIKSGDLFVVYYNEMYLNGELSSAIGIFKSEKTDVFLQVEEKETDLELLVQRGIALKKIDKACLIILTEEQGTVVLTVDNNNYDATYWKDDFLGVTVVKDENFETKAYMDLCKSFAKDVIGNNETKKEEIDFMTQTVQFFEENEHIETEKFNATIFEGVEELKDDFIDYKKAYESEYNIEIADSFDISQPVLQREKKAISNTIRLDTNIQLKLNFNDGESIHRFVEQGYDEDKGMHYYKVFYNKEF